MHLLIGAGGHAKALAEACAEAGREIDAYVDPVTNHWLAARWIKDDSDTDGLERGTIVIGMGGYKPDQLRRRLHTFHRYREMGWAAPPVIHPDAMVSGNCTIGEGACVLAGAVIQPGAVIGEAVIVNTGAIVEHDSRIGEGTHVAPKAVVLGGCEVGKTCMIGSGAVVLQRARVKDGTLVKSLERYPV